MASMWSSSPKRQNDPHAHHVNTASKLVGISTIYCKRGIQMGMRVQRNYGDYEYHARIFKRWLSGVSRYLHIKRCKEMPYRG